jgi:hypothetical protein
MNRIRRTLAAMLLGLTAAAVAAQPFEGGSP